LRGSYSRIPRQYGNQGCLRQSEQQKQSKGVPPESHREKADERVGIVEEIGAAIKEDSVEAELEEQGKSQDDESK
jgi:hypothetical protein